MIIGFYLQLRELLWVVDRGFGPGDSKGLRNIAKLETNRWSCWIFSISVGLIRSRSFRWGHDPSRNKFTFSTHDDQRLSFSSVIKPKTRFYDVKSKRNTKFDSSGDEICYLSPSQDLGQSLIDDRDFPPRKFTGKILKIKESQIIYFDWLELKSQFVIKFKLEISKLNKFLALLPSFEFGRSSPCLGCWKICINVPMNVKF
jgi:hypothetical protein